MAWLPETNPEDRAVQCGSEAMAETSAQGTG